MMVTYGKKLGLLIPVQKPDVGNSEMTVAGDEDELAQQSNTTEEEGVVLVAIESQSAIDSVRPRQ